ncbi:phage terminase small subunit [Acinetobacter sp. VNK23]|uniref:phage terminase small subunit n=1 Tax=Acinetobacter thutiue TaxID=2998078 RepID=UPI002575961D|nr:phage terminase small subunit [Acinetobacter thutiue]MDM1022061.1 phage terminase small subunit [Acinetobacter thutiue]
MSLARKHFQKHQAQSAAGQAAEFGSMRNLNAYEQQLLQLNTDKARLKQIQSTQNKVELKRQLIPTYVPYVQGILETRPGLQDEIISEMLVWAIDIHDFGLALDLAEYVLEKGLKLPDRFDRTEACFITEEITDAFLKILKTSVDVDITILDRLESLVSNEALPPSVRDMPDEVKARLYLALGKAEIRLVTGESEVDVPHAINAKNYLEQALELDDKCGGKTDLTKMEKLVQKISPLTTHNLAATLSETESTEQQEVLSVNLLMNKDGTPVVDDHGSLISVP